MSERPVSVSEYSTLGGTCGYTLRLMSPSASRFLRVPDNTRVEMSGIRRLSSLNRTVPSLSMTSSTRSDHLSPNRATTLRIGQISIIDAVSYPFFIVYYALLCKDTAIFVCINYSVNIFFGLITVWASAKVT